MNERFVMKLRSMVLAASMVLITVPGTAFGVNAADRTVIQHKGSETLANVVAQAWAKHYRDAKPGAKRNSCRVNKSFLDKGIPKCITR